MLERTTKHQTTSFQPMTECPEWEFDTFGEEPTGKATGHYWQIILGANPARALSEAQAFASELALGAEPRWLTLLGPSGLGKTHLCRRIIRYHRRALRGRGGASGRMPWVDMLDYLRNRQFGVAHDVCNDFLVCLDDIGAGHETDFGRAKLYEILERRMGKWTLITANLTFGEIGRIDARIASRLIRGENRTVEVAGRDFALRTRSGSRCGG